MSAGVALHSTSTGQPELSSPYWSLNTALLASQPYTQRSRISRLAPVLFKALSSYTKLESRTPEGPVFHHLIDKSYYEKAKLS